MLTRLIAPNTHRSRNTQEIMQDFLAFILLVLVSTLILRALWNHSLVKHITVLKPLKTVLDAFLLSLAINCLR